MSRIPQFFADEVDERAGKAVVRGGEFTHLRKVLRLGEGDRVLVTDGQGGLYHGTVAAAEGGRAEICLVSRAETNNESPLDLTLVQAVPKRRKMEWVLQKATELGVRRIVPVSSVRSVPRISNETWQKKRQRWEQIIREAAKQSYRSRLPELADPVPLDEAVKAYRGSVGLFLSPEGNVSLRECLDNSSEKMKNKNRVTLVIGPEGGFTLDETEFARKEGYCLCTTGPRVLRLETAVVKVLGILQYVFGDG